METERIGILSILGSKQLGTMENDHEIMEEGVLKESVGEVAWRIGQKEAKEWLSCPKNSSLTRSQCFCWRRY